jgi:hypothetical protein
MATSYDGDGAQAGGDGRAGSTTTTVERRTTQRRLAGGGYNAGVGVF